MINRSELEDFIRRTCPEGPQSLENAEKWLEIACLTTSAYKRFKPEDVLALWEEGLREKYATPNELSHKRGQR